MFRRNVMIRGWLPGIGLYWAGSGPSNHGKKKKIRSSSFGEKLIGTVLDRLALRLHGTSRCNCPIDCWTYGLKYR